MMYGRMKSRLLASALAAVLAPTAAVASFGAATEAQAAVQKAGCRVSAVVASKEGDAGIPKELAFLEAQLGGDEFAVYKSFYLVEQNALEITLGKTTEVKFRSGNRLGLSLLGNDDQRLKLHANLTNREGTKSLLAADYSIEDGGVMMISAGTFEHQGVPGKLFFAIQCARSG